MNTNYIFIPIILLLFLSCSQDSTELKINPKPEKLYSVSINMKFGFIDREGNVVIEPKFDVVMGDFKALLHPVLIGKWKTDKWGYINRSGDYVVRPKFDYAFNFSEGLAVVGINEKVGYIDENGILKIKLKFDSASEFIEGRAWVKIDNKWGFINKNGYFILRPRFDVAFPPIIVPVFKLDF